MKKIILLFLILTCIVGLLTACSEKNNNETIAFTLDTNGNYTGFSNLPKNITIEDAGKEGYFVKRDLEVIANNEGWAKFVETATQGDNTGIRIVRYNSEDITGPYVSDLFFNDGYYYLFDSSSDKQDLQPFSYLLTLEGQLGLPTKDSKVIIVTNNNTLTFNDVITSLVSSQFNYGVIPYRVVMF